MHFNSTILIVPGLGNSGEQHWQSIWEKEHKLSRIQQSDWETPVCADWIANINKAVDQHDPANVILVGHSLACAAIAYWAQQYPVKIKGALLVALSDTEADSFPTGTAGFAPMPLIKLPFPTIAVASANDYYVTIQRAQQFATAWGSELINIGEAGHINSDSGFGRWEEGLEILKRLDR
jgi:predicted alpha/beta hydrolase family esterase